MKLSAFTIIKNAQIYDFPIVESIMSAIDIVDEYVVLAGDSSDDTNRLIEAIDSPKLKIYYNTWDIDKYSKNGTIYAYQTDKAMRYCTGDWCLYLQSDEAVHHDSLKTIREACEKYLDDHRVEGFVFKYKHFYGDYDHYIDALHFAYPREIRLVRNIDDIHSWRDAQSFRVIPKFDYEDYCQKEGARKLNCILLNAYIYHYGWARHPVAMVGKMKHYASVYGRGDSADNIKAGVDYYEYGNISTMAQFKGTHPHSMKKRVREMSWKKLLRYDGPNPNMKKKFKTKYRIMSFIENKIMGGKIIGGFKNYNLISQ
ncbi:MAG: glycosyltransferase family 2 protein [Rikenellaceae bacterium]